MSRPQMVRYDNEKRNAEILRRRAAGDGPRKIARDLGLSVGVVSGVLVRALATDPEDAHAGARGNDYTPEYRAWAASLLDTMSSRAAARLAGVGQGSVRLWAKRLSGAA